MAVSGDYLKLRSVPAPDAPPGLGLVNNWTGEPLAGDRDEGWASEIDIQVETYFKVEM